MVDVLRAAEAKLSAMVDKKIGPEGSCSRCRGSCILLANYRAMGKTCNKRHKLNHFESLLRSTRVAEFKPHRQYQHRRYTQKSPRLRQYYTNHP